MLLYADKIEEIKTICWCGRKATMVARVINGKMVRSGEQILLGDDELYVSLCRKHYNEGRIKPEKPDSGTIQELFQSLGTDREE